MLITTTTTTTQPFVPSELGQARDETQKTQRSRFRHVDSQSLSAPIQSYLLRDIPIFKVSLNRLVPSQFRSTSTLFTLSTCFSTPLAPAPPEASVGHVQTISTDVGYVSPQLVPPLPFPEQLCSGLYPSLCVSKTTVTSASLLHSVAGYVAF